ncbi:hypothetical protein MAR_008756, partial [Mya arenaria]
TCSAGNNECATTPNSHCVLSTTTCTCATIAPDVGGTCTPTTCANDGECTTLDANSKCTAGSCTCTDSYYLDGADDVATCVAKAVGATCALGECSVTPGQVCDNTLASPVCACALGYKDSSGTCTANVEGDTCTKDGYECIAAGSAFCDTSGTTSVCACGAVYTLTGCVGI